MNICILSGHLARDAVVKGKEKKLLLFTIVTSNIHDEKEAKERSAYVPCVLFNPSPELETALVQGGKNKYVELQGRINSSSYEANGERRFVTEVVVFNRTLSLVNR